MLGDHARMVGLALAWKDVTVLLAGLVLVVKHVSLGFVFCHSLNCASLYICHELRPSTTMVSMWEVSNVLNDMACVGAKIYIHFYPKLILFQIVFEVYRCGMNANLHICGLHSS